MARKTNIPHWNWEIAYKKLFWLRFILLLVVLGLSIALACITFHS